MERLIFATGNADKMKEIREILSDVDVEPVSMKELGITVDIEENGKTFEENAYIKAKTIARLTGELVLADDSGLEIDALGKEPGIHSARYLGENTSYETKNQEILRRMEHVGEKDRSARFVCAICAVFPDGTHETVRGVMEGVIGREAQGENGFGYDPIFYIPEYGCSTATLTMEQKNKISHRGNALRKIKEVIKKRSL